MSKKYKVVITDFLSIPADIEREVFGNDYEIVQLNKNHEDQLGVEIEDADALLVWHEIKLGEKTISRLKNCKTIVRYGVGFDNVDLKATGIKNIRVCNVPDYGTNDVADHSMALLLTIVRGISAYNHGLIESEDNWDWNKAGTLIRLTNKTFGAIGMGRIGIATAMRAKAFGMNVIFYDPYVRDGMDKALGIESVTKEELLKRSDIISFHTPLTEETRNLADENFFSQAKNGVIIINTARGPIIDFKALYNAMKSNKVRAAGLDVLPTEPLDMNDPLVKAWKNQEGWINNRVLITPHAAFYSDEAFAELRRKTAMEAKRIIEGQEARNCVNREFLVAQSH